MERLKPVKEGSLRFQVSRSIRQAIFSGHFAPGAQLLEMRLAGDLQVSQTTVREALVQLEQIGLVNRVPNRGTFVTNLSQKDVQDRLSIRMLLEGLAWVAASLRMKAGQFAELEERLQRIKAMAGSDEYFEKAEAELDFHRYIWEQSGNPCLAQTLNQLTPALFAFITVRRKQSGVDAKHLVSSHQRVLEALQEGDPIRIKAALREHLESSYGPFFDVDGAGLPEFIGQLAEPMGTPV